MKTISEVASIVGMNENIIHKWLKTLGAPKPKEKNKYGHYWFDEDDINILWMVKFYKDMGYTNPEISRLLNSSAFNRNEALKTQIEYLEKKLEEDKKMLEIAKSMLDNGVTVPAIKSGISENVTYDEAIELKKTVLQFQPEEKGNETMEEFWNQEVSEHFLAIISNISALKKRDYLIDSEKVQNLIYKLHNLLTDFTSDSVYAFHMFAVGFAPGGELAEDIDNSFGNDTSNYIFEACEVYYTNNRNTNPTDIILIQSLQNIVILASNGFKPESDEVQQEINRIYGYFSEMKFIPEEQRPQMLLSMAVLFETSIVQNRIPGNSNTAITSYIACAINHYCKKFLCN